MSNGRNLPREGRTPKRGVVAPSLNSFSNFARAKMEMEQYLKTGFFVGGGRKPTVAIKKRKKNPREKEKNPLF